MILLLLMKNYTNLLYYIKNVCVRLFLEIKCEKNDVCLSRRRVFDIINKMGECGTEVMGKNDESKRAKRAGAETVFRWNFGDRTALFYHRGMVRTV